MIILLIKLNFYKKTNASFYGMNQLNRVGVLYNSIRVNDQLAMDNKYVFGSIAFQEKNFSLGFDVNSFKLNDIGMTTSMAYLSYVYKIQISNYTFFLPGISVGMISSRINPVSLNFWDGLILNLGFLVVSSLLLWIPSLIISSISPARVLRFR